MTTSLDERMEELANFQIDIMDSGDLMEIVIDSLKEYWTTYPEDFEDQWDEYKSMVGESYEDRD